MTLTRDPKGFYIALGIDETADADAIKSAYRSKAKRLHPDFNPSPVAAKQFHRLHEAYETLSDPAKRAAYDKPWRTESAKTAGANSGAHGGGGEQEPRNGQSWTHTAASSAEPQRDAQAPRKEHTARAASSSTSEGPVTCKCGKVTAQPRYIVFDLVWGRLTHLQRRGISGVFCRSCADRTAVRASLVSWLAGWWAWPNGPKETVKALLNNIRGGRKPPERNARLLMRQARSFRARGEMELARNAAEQAIPFAVTPHLRHDVDSLLLSLSSHPARALKDRWQKPGWSATVQLLPLAVIVAGIAIGATLLSPVSLHAAVRNLLAGDGLPTLPTLHLSQHRDAPPPNMATGRVYTVSVKQANLRTGPGSHYQMLSMLPQGTLVLVTEADPTGMWLRVATPDGAVGFVAAGQLSPDVRIDVLEDMGGFSKAMPARPPPGEPATSP